MSDFHFQITIRNVLDQCFVYCPSYICVSCDDYAIDINDSSLNQH